MSDAGLVLSLNEVDSLVRKAALGADLPVGHAEDLGAAAAWLCRADLPGAAAALADLEAWREGRTVRAQAGRTADGWRLDSPDGRPLAAWFAAPALADLAALCDGGRLVAVATMHTPLLAYGALGLATAHGTLHAGTMLEWDGGATVVSPDGDDAALERLAQAWVLALTVRPAPANAPTVASGRATVRPNGVALARATYARLEALARLTLVPESETSRARGAGAGLRDTD